MQDGIFQFDFFRIFSANGIGHLLSCLLAAWSNLLAQWYTAGGVAVFLRMGRAIMDLCHAADSHAGLLERTAHRALSRTMAGAKAALWVSLVFDLGVLFCFKYLGFAVELVNGIAAGSFTGAADRNAHRHFLLHLSVAVLFVGFVLGQGGGTA